MRADGHPVTVPDTSTATGEVRERTRLLQNAAADYIDSSRELETMSREALAKSRTLLAVPRNRRWT